MRVNDHVAASGVATPLDVSVRVRSDRPVMAERPIYFAADPGLGVMVDGGHNVIGATGGALVLGFAEGTVRPGFVEYVTIQNANPVPAAVTLSFQASLDGGAPAAVPDLAVAVPAGSRATVHVNDHVASSGLGDPLNVSVLLVSDVPVMAERPVYFAADPGLGMVVDGGTNVVGVAA